MEPAFFDNVGSIVKDDLVARLGAGDRVSVASAAFSMYAYRELREQLEEVGEFRFIFTSPTFVSEHTAREKREFYIPRLQRERGLCGTEFEIKLRNELEQKSIAIECAEWIRSKACFRSFAAEDGMENTFMVIDQGDEALVYAPFSEFSTSGLGVGKSQKRYCTITRNGTPAARQFLQMFDGAWDSGELADVTEAVLDGIGAMYAENAPELVYYLALQRIFSEFLDDVSEDVLPREGTGFRESAIWNKLYDFQKDAALAIINKLETYNGCILADSVGLGKTFTALAVIKYYECRNRNVLVLCPKKLRDNWTTYASNQVNNPIAADRLRYDVLFHTDLSRSRGTSATGINLNLVNWGNYDLVVIDESHNFRNGGDSASSEKMNRYQLLMEKVIRQGVKTKVLMLSATPVNNRFRDLSNQLALAYGDDPAAWGDKLGLRGDVEAVFRNAQKVYNQWVKLPTGQRSTQTLTDRLDPDFFTVLDQVTVARSRKHIQGYYDMSAIGPFPQRNKPISRRPKLATIEKPITYEEIYGQLEELGLAVYMPSKYLLASRRSKYVDEDGNLSIEGREKGLLRLMETNLLKRLESSVHAFRLTLQRMEQSMDKTLKNIERFMDSAGGGAVVLDDEELLEGLGFDEDDASALSDGRQVHGPTQTSLFDDDGEDGTGRDEHDATGIALEDMDVIRWGDDIAKDREIVRLLLGMLEDIDPAHDAKLIQLCDDIRAKVERPINPGNKKVLVFTAFSDTARYLYDTVAQFAARELDLHTALVTGDGCTCGLPGVPSNMTDILACFAPRAKERATVAPHLEGKDIDILIATDCISEGQNLQDCDYVLNYDIHWNPVRIVQRFGRVDRIGSKMECIQLVNYWPDMELDSYINLKDRVENRMHAVVLTATGDDDPINENEQGDLEYRRRQLEQMQDEVIDLEDVQGGVSITDLGLDEFRMDLLEYYRANPDIDHVPNGIHAVVAGEEPGVVFILRNVNAGMNPQGTNRLHPFYVVHVADDGHVVHGHLQPKAVLDYLRVLCRGKGEPDAKLCHAFNRATDDGRDMRREAGLLRHAVGSIVNAKELTDAESFFSEGPTSFREGDIAGLDDFELVCFFVVRPPC